MKPKHGFNSHFLNEMDTLGSWLLSGYTIKLYTCVCMTDIRCSFVVDYDVYFDENVGDKQTGDQTWENQCVHHDCAQM